MCTKYVHMHECKYKWNQFIWDIAKNILVCVCQGPQYNRKLHINLFFIYSLKPDQDKSIFRKTLWPLSRSYWTHPKANYYLKYPLKNDKLENLSILLILAFIFKSMEEY